MPSVDHTPKTPFSLNPALDVDRLAHRFKDTQRLQIEDFLTQAAADALHAHLRTDTRWRHIINGKDQVFETPADIFDAMPAQQKAALDRAMFATAIEGFQFQYDTIRVDDAPEARRKSSSLLDDFARFMSSEQTLNLLRRVSGKPNIRFADAQATRYRAGDFLTRHDDAIAGKDRVLAYVMNISRDWRAEWGGLLLFNDDRGGLVDAMTPRFNTLSLFAVPQPHSVSYVAPYAAGLRLSVTGWLRTSIP